MTLDLDAALAEVRDHLVAWGVPYMVIRGYANLVWGRPRLTSDLDITVRVGDAGIPDFVTRVTSLYPPAGPLGNPVEFARSTRVVPVRLPSGIRAEFILAGIPFEEQAIDRARECPLSRGTVRVCTAEDLVIHKIISNRPRDIEDVKGIIERQRAALDLGYLRPRVRELADLLERPEIMSFLQECLRENTDG